MVNRSTSRPPCLLASLFPGLPAFFSLYWPMYPSFFLCIYFVVPCSFLFVFLYFHFYFSSNIYNKKIELTTSKLQIHHLIHLNVASTLVTRKYSETDKKFSTSFFGQEFDFMILTFRIWSSGIK